MFVSPRSTNERPRLGAIETWIADKPSRFLALTWSVAVRYNFLVCDLVGSIHIAAYCDLEEALDIIGVATRDIVTPVNRCRGTVGRYMGDGVLAIFGRPKAPESHGEQAILAGLDIQKRMETYAKLVHRQYDLSNFKVRVGIKSRHVVAGQVAGAKGEYTVIGDAVHIASRFEAAA